MPRPKPSSRENGRHSHGPKTQAGKDRAKFNALRHGLLAQKVIVVPRREPEGLPRQPQRAYPPLPAPGRSRKLLRRRNGACPVEPVPRLQGRNRNLRPGPNLQPARKAATSPPPSSRWHQPHPRPPPPLPGPPPTRLPARPPHPHPRSRQFPLRPRLDRPRTGTSRTGTSQGSRAANHPAGQSPTGRCQAAGRTRAKPDANPSEPGAPAPAVPPEDWPKAA